MQATSEQFLLPEGYNTLPEVVYKPQLGSIYPYVSDRYL